MTRTSLVLLVLGFASLTQAQQPEIDIVIRDGGDPPVTLTLPAPGANAVSLDTRVGRDDYHVVVQRDSDRSNAPYVFQLRRVHTGGDAARSVRLGVSVRVRPGEPVVLARLERPDGTETTVTAQMR